MVKVHNIQCLFASKALMSSLFVAASLIILRTRGKQANPRLFRMLIKMLLLFSYSITRFKET